MKRSARTIGVASVPMLAAALLMGAMPAMLEAQQSPTSTGSASADASRPALRAVRVTSALVIDGRLSDEAWAHAPVADHFRQRDPDEGQPATERTEIRVLYDDARASGKFRGSTAINREPTPTNEPIKNGPEIVNLRPVL